MCALMASTTYRASSIQIGCKYVHYVPTVAFAYNLGGTAIAIHTVVDNSKLTESPTYNPIHILSLIR